MAVIALAGCSGAPGVTTTALALLFGWPLHPGRKVILAEADPDGGSILYGALQGRLQDQYSLRNLSVPARTGQLEEAFWAQLVDVADDGTSKPSAKDRLVLPGITAPTQAAGLAPAWEPLAALFTQLETHPNGSHDVLVDLGRRGITAGSAVLAQRADLTVLVARNTLRGLQAAQGRLEQLADHPGPVVLLLIEQSSYAEHEVAKHLGVEVLAALPYTPRQAEVFSDGAAMPAKFERGELMRHARTAATRLFSRVAEQRLRLARPHQPQPGGEVAAHAR